MLSVGHWTFDVGLMASFQQILGIRFFDGDVDEAIEQMLQNGGFLVAPSATCFARLRHDAAYRGAVVCADLALPDSGAMVLLWRILRSRKINRISGLKYLRHLSVRLFAGKDQAFWVLPNESARERMQRWLRANHFAFADEDFYVAPRYGTIVEDPQLLIRIESRKPQHVIVAIGSGPQEKLGHYLRDHLDYRPAIHCIGAALGFLTGDQVTIPDWADRFYLGWLFRLLAQPRIFIPRLARAFELPTLLIKYRENLPPLRTR
jgi:exopolysaccharide biosynthesis WecB/TagA/CpsF family protein